MIFYQINQELLIRYKQVAKHVAMFTDLQYNTYLFHNQFRYSRQHKHMCTVCHFRTVPHSCMGSSNTDRHLLEQKILQVTASVREYIKLF